MNELYFVSQILGILFFSYGALRLGKEALVTSVTIQAILANLFVLKQMTFFGFHMTCSDAFAIGSILNLNLLREYYGKDETNKAITACFFFLAFVVVMSQIHLKFTPSPFDTAQSAYLCLFKPAPRLLFASIAVFYAMQHLDLQLFGWLSKLLPTSSFSLRCTLSLATSQFFDTLLFSFLGLYGMVAKLGHIILVSYCLKLTIVLLLGPLTTLFRRWERSV